MKVTFVLPYADLSGGIKVVAIHSRLLRERGHEVTIVSTPPTPPTLRERARALVKRGQWLRTPRARQSHFQGLAVDHRIIDRPRPITDADVPDADVVLATWWRTASWVAALSPRKGKKALFIQGYEVMPGEENPGLDQTWRMPFQKIVVARWLKELAATRFGDPGAILVPVGVDPAQFNAPPRGKQAAPTVGFLFSESPFKGIGTVAAAIARARQKFPGLRVLAFGAHRPSPEVALPPDCEFHFQPAQGSIKELYARCDAWLCGSQREGFHLPPLEAMACRSPVVSTRVGGPQDLIEPGVNGFLVEPGDAEGLADRLCRVLATTDAEWRAMSDAALAAARRYTWESAASAMERALQATVERA